MPKRIQRRRVKGWRMPEGAVSVTRPHWASNPYRVIDSKRRWKTKARWYYIIDVSGKRVQYSLLPYYQSRLTAQRHAVDLFRRDLNDNPPLQERVKRELRDKDLACWCPLDQPCHADMLLRLASEEVA